MPCSKRKWWRCMCIQQDKWRTSSSWALCASRRNNWCHWRTSFARIWKTLTRRSRYLLVLFNVPLLKKKRLPRNLDLLYSNPAPLTLTPDHGQPKKPTSNGQGIYLVQNFGHVKVLCTLLIVLFQYNTVVPLSQSNLYFQFLIFPFLENAIFKNFSCRIHFRDFQFYRSVDWPSVQHKDSQRNAGWNDQ